LVDKLRQPFILILFATHVVKSRTGIVYSHLVLHDNYNNYVLTSNTSGNFCKT